MASGRRLFASSTAGSPRSSPTRPPPVTSSATRFCCLGWSTRTYTSTNPGAPIGRWSRAPPRLPRLAAGRRDGVRVSAETCPHYLAVAAEEVPEGGTQFKCCTPIRDAANRELLWQGLASGVLDCVVSDHSPCPPALKRFDTGDFGAAWGGIASLQLGLSVVWTHARRRGHALSNVVGWMADGPARLTGLRRKGRIAVGYDADLVAFAPDEPFVVDPDRLYHRHPVTPYAGAQLTGVVRTTWLRGEPVDLRPRGRLLSRGEA